MVARAKAAEATRDKILEAARGLFGELPYDQVSLNAVAARAGVGVHTVLRRFGSKEDLLAAVAAWRSARIRAERDATQVGDVAGAIANLVEDYERWGDEVLHFLAQEDRIPAIREVTQRGRAYHHAWVRRVFAPRLRRLAPEQRERRIVQLIAVTDLYTWKILRRDLGLGRDEVEENLCELAGQILRASPRSPS
jgi:AcrR family transcriptional regulator